MTQLVAPDLNTVGNVGWCLSFVEDAYNTPHLGATATDAWNATQFPHPGEQPPNDVQVPIWFSYTENGIDFGHVAINVPGRGVLSSPYKQNGTQQWFSSIEECRRVMGCTAYLGWSEDLATIKLIEGGNMEAEIQAIKDDLGRLYVTVDDINKRLQADIENLGRLYVTVDEINTRLKKIEDTPNSSLEGDYHIKPL
jgi:hypothetical protein